MHPTSSPSMTRRRPASASAKMVTSHILDEKHEETTDGPKSTSKTSTYLVIINRMIGMALREIPFENNAIYYCTLCTNVTTAFSILLSNSNIYDTSRIEHKCTLVNMLRLFVYTGIPGRNDTLTK